MMNETVSQTGNDDGGGVLFIDYDDILNKLNAQEALNMFPVIFFYAVVLTVGLFGNLLVLVVYTFRYKRSQARVFILFLAANDFLMCLFGLPYQMVDMTHPYKYTNALLCKVSTFIMVALFHTSVFGLVVIAVDRYTKICHPLGKFHTEYFGKKRACVIAVILGVLLSWPILFLYGPSEMETGVYNITGHACFYEYSDPDSNIVLIYSTATLCFCVGSTVCLIVLYSLVFYQIYSRYQRGASLQSLQRQAEDSTYYINEENDCECPKHYRNHPESGPKPENEGNERNANPDQYRRDDGIHEKDLLLSVQTKLGSKLNDQDKSHRKGCGIDSGDDDGDDDDENDGDNECIQSLIQEKQNEDGDVNRNESNDMTIENDNAFLVLKPVSTTLEHPSMKGELVNTTDESPTTTNDDTLGHKDHHNDHSDPSGTKRDKSVTIDNKNNDLPCQNTLNEAVVDLESEETNQKAKDLNMDKLNTLDQPTDSEINSDSDLESASDLKEAIRRYLFKNAPTHVNQPRSASFSTNSSNRLTPSKHGNAREVTAVRSSSLNGQPQRPQTARLSLPLNSIQSACSSRSSITSVNGLTNQRATSVNGANGLRIHSRSHHASQLCINGAVRGIKSGHSKITKIMITITTLFILSYTPSLIIIIWSNLTPDVWDTISIHETLVFEFCLRFYLINNVCNPFIYGFWDKRFKREVIFTLRKLANRLTCCLRK